MSNLLPTLQMSNEFCKVLIDMERNGLNIDLKALAELKLEYEEEYKTLKYTLQTLAEEALGDTPINLNSPEQLSRLIFSRRIKNKKQWVETFNLGTNPITGKSKRARFYRAAQFKKIIEYQAETVYKTILQQCPTCRGIGKVAKKKKNRQWSKPIYICPTCKRKGVLYNNTEEIAGFKCRITGSGDCSANGFSTNKEQLEKLARETKNEKAREFLTKMVRYNAVSTYLDTFVAGIERNVENDGILHTQFMQAVTATGRLSSRDPNIHNQPRGGTFPIRRVVTSRFKGGKILKADYAQLEFRIAGALSGDSVVLGDVLDGRDVHAYTSKVLTTSGQPTDRQDSKPHTFKPLYGGTSGTDAERSYYRAFLERYPRIKEWHEELCTAAITEGKIILPSEREYSFPNTRRYPSGTVSNGTKIKNYPVQGFATADIVPIAAILARQRMLETSVRSLLINEVHDELDVDVYPGEEEQMIELIAQAMLDVVDELDIRYGYIMTMPLEVEVSIGDNWLDCKTVLVRSHEL